MASDAPNLYLFPALASAAPASDYPHVWWEETEATFLSRGTPVPEGEIAAVVVFAFMSKDLNPIPGETEARSGEDHRVVVADIVGRGWCVPSGRLEPGETAAQAAHREAGEEAGLTLAAMRELGTFVLKSGSEIRLAPAYLAVAVEMSPQLPSESESRGVRLAARQDLPALYYRWDPLLAGVFDLAFAEAGG